MEILYLGPLVHDTDHELSLGRVRVVLQHTNDFPKPFFLLSSGDDLLKNTTARSPFTVPVLRARIKAFLQGKSNFLIDLTGKGS